MINHVPLLSTCKKLKELGYPQKHNLCKWAQHSYDWLLYDKEDFGALEECPQCAAPLATELLEWLPTAIEVNKNFCPLHITPVNKEETFVFFMGSNISKIAALPEALAQMLIYLVENKIVSFEKEKV